MKKLLSLLAMALMAASCQTTSKKSSAVKSLGPEQRKVIYADEGNVFAKVCEPPFARGIHRNCASKAEPISMTLEAFIANLDLDVGKYSRDEDGLAEASAALDRVKQGYSAATATAATEIERLRPIKSNLELIVKLKEDLTSKQKDITTSSYAQVFSTLWETVTGADTAETLIADKHGELPQ